VIRSLIFTLLLAFLSLSFGPHIAWTQSTEPETETVVDPVFVHSEDDMQRAFRAVKRDDAYQFELAEPIPPKPASAFEKFIGKVFNAIFSFLGLERSS